MPSADHVTRATEHSERIASASALFRELQSNDTAELRSVLGDDKLSVRSDEQIVRQWLRQEGDPNVVNENGVYLLEVAVLSPKLDALAELLDAGLILDSSGPAALRRAIHEQNGTAVQMLVEAGAPVNQKLVRQAESIQRSILDEAERLALNARHMGDIQRSEMRLDRAKAMQSILDVLRSAVKDDRGTP